MTEEDTMRKLSTKSVKLLRQAGWSKDRSIDTTPFERLFKEKKLEFFPVVAEFFRQFGNLYLVNPYAIPPATKDWHFDVARAIELGARSIPYYRDRLDEDVSPIGMESREHTVLMMNEQGKVYSGYDQLIWIVGDSGIDAINALSEGRKLEQLS